MWERRAISWCRRLTRRESANATQRRLARDLGAGGTVYLTARDEARGRAAIEALESENLSPKFHALDVTSDQSVQSCASTIARTHGGVDIVISNAAARITKDASPAAQVDHFLDTNNAGTNRMIHAFGPLLNDGARFVVVASGFGSLTYLDRRLHHLFDVATATYEDIDRVMAAYARLVHEGKAREAGWPEWINIPSKIAQVATMKIFARMTAREARRRDILINAACPGLVDTEASRPWFDDMLKARSPDDAAVDVAWLATLPPRTREPYGELVRYRGVLAWTESESEVR